MSGTASNIGETVLVQETKQGRFQVQVISGSSTFLADEPRAVGGLGTGPNPYDLLSAALGSCTVMTIRLYAEHKKWPLERVRAKVTHHRPALQARDVFSREIVLEGELDETQRAKLLEIADHCPVHVTLDRGADIQTTLVPADPHAAPSSKGEHMKTMTETMTSAAA